MLLETEFAPGMHLFIGATGKLSADRPGNGGFRIWKYDSKDDAAAEVMIVVPALVMSDPMSLWILVASHH